MAKKHTWEYVEGGCPACNVTGQIVHACPTWNSKGHNRNTCPCKGGVTYSTCKTCKGRGHR